MIGVKHLYSAVKTFPIVFALTLGSTAVSAAEGAIEIQSQFNFEKTIQTLQSTLKEKGMTIFAVVDHTKGAHSVGIELLPTTLFIFGNPKAGSPLMKCSQSMALDLPQKMLISENKKGDVTISYNDPTYLAKRHNLIGCEKNILGINKALLTFSKKAAGID